MPTDTEKLKARRPATRMGAGDALRWLERFLRDNSAARVESRITWWPLSRSWRCTTTISETPQLVSGQGVAIGKSIPGVERAARYHAVRNARKRGECDD